MNIRTPRLSHTIVALVDQVTPEVRKDEFNIPEPSASASVHLVRNKELLNLKEIPIWDLGFSCRDRGPGTG